MLSVTFKSVLKLLANTTNFSGLVTGNKVTIEAFDEDETKYVFTVQSRVVRMAVKSEKGDFDQTVTDLEMLTLPELTVKTVTNETFTQSGDPYDSYTIYVTYNAQVFVMVCRLIKERALFRIRHFDNVFDAHYIDGKLYFHKEDETTIKLCGTNLFALNKEMPDYEVLYIDNLPGNITYRTLNERFESTARTVGKKLEKYKEGQLQK